MEDTEPSAHGVLAQQHVVVELCPEADNVTAQPLLTVEQPVSDQLLKPKHVEPLPAQ